MNLFISIYNKLRSAKNFYKSSRSYLKKINQFLGNKNAKYKYFNKKELKEVILCCTTFPARLDYFVYTLFSVIEQSIRPSKIILWLSEEEFPSKFNDIPEILRKFYQYNFEIRFVKDNIKSYKKLIYALQDYPEYTIVTFDDDIYYKPNWLELLYNTHINYPSDIVGHRIHKINFKNNYIDSYINWKWKIKEETSSYLYFATGAGGILYPPGSLFKDACNKDLFWSLSPSADDVWFYVMAVMNKTKIRKTKKGYNKLYLFSYVLEKNYKKIPKLSDINLDNHQNDVQIKKVLEYYNIYDLFYNIYGNNDT